MDKKENKIKLPKWLNLALVIAEIALTAALVTISIIALVTLGSATGFIKWLQLNPLWFFLLIVLPLVILFLLNVFLLIKAVNTQKDKDLSTAGMTQEQLLEEAKRQARAELEAEMKNAVAEKSDK
jgi:uncharacterized membrane protein